MRTLVSILMVTSLLLAGCGGIRDSKMNPGNWFGKSRSTRVAQTTPTEQDVNPLIPQEADRIIRRKFSKKKEYAGTEVQQITGLVVEQSAGGAIIRATGLPLRNGAFDVQLTPESVRSDGKPLANNGVLAFRLEALQPTDTPQGNERIRRVTGAKFVSTQTLRDVREIRVIGVSNFQSSRR